LYSSVGSDHNTVYAQHYLTVFSNVTDYSQEDHLLIQRKIHQDLNRPRKVVQEAQLGQEVLEAHVLTRLEGPTKIAITTIIHGNKKT
jgi:hypothetical protein